MPPSTSFAVATSWVLAIVVIGLGIYDYWVALRYGPASTISTVVLELAKSHPIITLLIGIVVGHLLWPQISVVAKP